MTFVLKRKMDDGDWTAAASRRERPNQKKKEEATLASENLPANRLLIIDSNLI